MRAMRPVDDFAGKKGKMVRFRGVSDSHGPWSRTHYGFGVPPRATAGQVLAAQPLLGYLLSHQLAKFVIDKQQRLLRCLGIAVLDGGENVGGGCPPSRPTGPEARNFQPEQGPSPDDLGMR